MGKWFLSENSERSVAGSGGDVHLCRRYTEISVTCVKCVMARLGRNCQVWTSVDDKTSLGLISMRHHASYASHDRKEGEEERNKGKEDSNGFWSAVSNNSLSCRLGDLCGLLNRRSV